MEGIGHVPPPMIVPSVFRHSRKDYAAAYAHTPLRRRPGTFMNTAPLSSHTALMTITFFRALYVLRQVLRPTSLLCPTVTHLLEGDLVMIAVRGLHADRKNKKMQSRCLEALRRLKAVALP